LWIANELMKNYRRAAYIDTGCYDKAEYYAYTCQFAEFFKMSPVVVPGSLEFFTELLAGDWRRCLEVKPGEQLSEENFRQEIPEA
jgi:hypothetical protein